MRHAIVRALVLLSVVFLITCKKQQSQPSTDKVKIVVTIPVLADFAQQVGGDRVQVTNLLFPGASPHTFEPTPSQAKAAAQADLVVRVGLDADRWIQGLLPSGVAVVTAAQINSIDLIIDDEHHEEEHTVANPHIWLDPLYAKLITQAIADSLISIDPRGKTVYEKNRDRYLAELDSLNTRIEEAVASFTSREYVSFHPAWIYFAVRYHLKQVGVIAESAGKEPTPKRLREVIEAIKGAGVRAVFAEPQLSPKAAQAIAREAGVKVLFLDPLGREGEGYVQLMDRNLAVLTQALGDR